MSSRLLASAIWFLTLAPVAALPLVAMAESPASEAPPPAATDEKPAQAVEPGKKVEKAESARPAAAPSCPKVGIPAATIPVYVDTWGRLADLTESDPEVGQAARFWAKRDDATATVLATGTIIGSGAILFGTINRLTNDNWTTTSKWQVAGGAGLVLTSMLVWWLFSPDRGDFLTAINHWNLRHRDRPLAP